MQNIELIGTRVKTGLSGYQDNPIIYGILTGVTDTGNIIIDGVEHDYHINGVYPYSDDDILIERLCGMDHVAIECDCVWDNYENSDIIRKLKKTNNPEVVIYKLAHIINKLGFDHMILSKNIEKIALKTGEDITPVKELLYNRLKSINVAAMYSGE